MSIIYVITKEGIFYFEGGAASQAILQRFQQAILSGEASVVVVNSVNGAAPVVSVFDNVNDAREIAGEAWAGDLNATARDSLAMFFGFLAGLAAVPAGPAASV